MTATTKGRRNKHGVSAETRAQIKSLKLETEWKSMVEAWHMYTACRSCGDVKICRGKTRDKMNCKECHFGK